MHSAPSTARRILDYVVFPAIVLALLVLAFLLWNTRKQQALLQLEETTRLAGIALRAEIQSTYEDIVAAMERLAIRQPPDSPRRAAQWSSDSEFYISAFAGLTRVFWVDASYTVQLVVPAGGEEAQVGDSAQSLEASPSGLLLVQPAQYDGRFVGFAFGRVELPLLFSSVAGETADRYNVLFTEGPQPLLEIRETTLQTIVPPTALTLELPDAGVFTLTISPTMRTVTNAFTDARTTLLVGLLVTAAVASVILVAQLGRRLLVQERLRRQWEVFERTLDGIPQAVYVVDPSTYEVLFANEKAQQLFSVEPVGAECFRALRGLDSPCPFCAMDVLPKNGAPHTWEWRHDELRRDLLMSDRLIDWPGNEFVRLTIATDITELKEAERNRLALEGQLRQSQKLESIGTLASGIAHEVNNPLMGIINYAELLKEQARDEEAQGFVMGIIREGNRVAKIVRSLLSFARQDKEAHSPALIGDIVEQALSLTSAALRKDGITLAVDIPDDLPAVRCRSQQIEQVIINLVTNARDALNERFQGFHEEKLLNIDARAVEKDGVDWVHVVMEDRGTGIPENMIERAFDPFFTTKRHEKGTGLGLSVSYGIVEEHGGKLWVESKLGQYTRFHMELRVNNGWSLGKTSTEGEAATESLENDGKSLDRR